MTMIIIAAHKIIHVWYVKNESKFECLDGIAMEMGIRFDELIGKILPSITKAFRFEDKTVEHSEQNCQIFYKSVVLSVSVVNTLGITQAEDVNKMKQNSWISRLLDGNHFIINVNLKKLLTQKEKAQAKVKLRDSKLKVMNDTKKLVANRFFLFYKMLL